MLKKIYNWFVISSANPEKTSLTLKAGAASIITVLTMVLGFAHVAVGSEDLTRLSDSIIALIQAIAFIISICVTIFGLLRKIWLTVTGNNVAL